MPIYLDNAATTFPDERVIQTILSCLRNRSANASSQHRAGIQAAMLIENARKLVAQTINADIDEVYFEAGGTESNNAVIKGVAAARKEHGDHIIVSAIEHPSILEPARWLQRQGFRISYVKVDREGVVDPADVVREITSETILVSVMHANNEIGTIQPIKMIGQICREKEIYFHTDACQSFTKVPIDVRRDFLDMVTLNSHKIHGPKGVSALYVRKGVVIDPLMHGGQQEHGLRAGTHNIEGIVGFGRAVEIVNGNDVVRMTHLRDHFIHQIENNIAGVVLHGARQQRLCNNINLSFQGVKGKELFAQLNAKRIFVSTGSACTSNILEASHVLLALGINATQAHEAVRLTLSKWTTKKDIDSVVNYLKSFVAKARRNA